MPNNRRGGRDRSNYYKGNEHDDRVPSHNNDGGRRVSFKNHNSGRNKHNRQRGWDTKVRAALMDEDIEMSGNIRGNERFYPDRSLLRVSERFSFARNIMTNINNNRRRNNHDEGGWGRNPKFFQESPTQWYKISVRNGHKYDKDYLLKLLAGFIKPHTMVPYLFKVSRDETSFIVEDHQAAQELANADRKITANDGWKLFIRVRPVTPFVEIDTKLSTAIKGVMSTRYNAELKTLNLSKFHSDGLFISQDVFCPLNRPNIMMAVLDIIGEIIPDLIALDLSDNKLNVTEHMKLMVEKCPNVKMLHLGNNKLRDIKQLEALKGLPLEELILDGNSLCDRFSEQETYIRAVRQRFPKVIKLDGMDLPPPILFDVEDEGRLPVSRPSFLASEEGAIVVRQFIEQYYFLYDAEGSREPLHQAYHDSAVFSLDAYAPPGEPYGQMGPYLAESRNLTRVSNLDRRVRLMKKGKLSIVEALNHLPRTKHYPTTFHIDLVIFTPQLIQLNVCGLFSETVKKTPMRYFNRVFLIVPTGSGFCIINDQLTVLLATSEQVKKYNKIKAEAAAAAASQPDVPPPVVPVPVPVPEALPVANAIPVAEPDLAMKQQMVTTLAANTGMNLIWSEKCLNETNWNFEQAMFAFNKLQKAGSIPAQAFVK
ncbi:nuclear RNA export factor 1 isoform X2 [Halyomorpha halys]|uniref:nuclear RNA export factor 1 isoform X2 n=1 Tax=Halyomorpha halys TaxID=286706 RepID=UPI0006D52061|nr:nuclear RNA export factor 1 isoform X2 [Halyomorpha halys]